MKITKMVSASVVALALAATSAFAAFAADVEEAEAETEAVETTGDEAAAEDEEAEAEGEEAAAEGEEAEAEGEEEAPVEIDTEALDEAISEAIDAVKGQLVDTYGEKGVELIGAAVSNGVQAFNVQQLANFIEQNGDKFTDEQYAGFIAAINEAGDIVRTYTDEDLATMEEADKTALFKSMSADDRQAILDKMVAAGAAAGVTITYTQRSTNDGYDVTATFETTPATPGNDDGGNGNNDGNQNDNTAPNKQSEKKEDAVAKTGEVNSVNTAAAVMATLVIGLAGAGIVVVAKKNREN